MTPALKSALSLFQRGKLPEARAAIAKILRVRGDSGQALQLMGMVLTEMGDRQQAVAHLKRAVAIDPDNASVHFNLGKAQTLAGRPEDAVDSFARALQLDPGRAETHLAHGNALSRLGHDDEAIASFRRALAINPDLADAHFHIGRLLSKRDMEGALAAFDQMLKREPKAADGRFWKAFCQQELCDWTDYDARIASLAATIHSGEPVENFSFTFFLATVCDDNAILRKAAAMELARSAVGKPAAIAGKRRDRIRVAYISGDFRNHATSRLMAGLIEAHDRQKFEVIGISIGPSDASPMRKRVEAAFDTFEDMGASSPRKVCERARALGIDIAVDLVGHTLYGMSGIYHQRIAPLQVNFLGFPGTMGGDAFDYVVVDPFIATEDLRRNSVEKLVVMPDCYQPNDDKRQVAEARPTRSDEGLPEDAFVFCCFNQTRKITPQAFDVWMRVLLQVDNSVLWLLNSVWLSGSRDPCVANLRAEAAGRGVDPDRLVFARRVPQEDHLARIALADLSLDTFPYTAHTTASDALWAGCPIVTLTGTSFASRVCGSLLHTVGLPELATDSWQAFETLAVRLAKHPDELRAIRERLAASRQTSPLFDTQRFARNIERAYTEMMRRHLAAEPTAEIDVGALA